LRAGRDLAHGDDLENVCLEIDAGVLLRDDQRVRCDAGDDAGRHELANFFEIARIEKDGHCALGWMGTAPDTEYSAGVSICQIHDHRLCLDNLTGPPHQKSAHRHTSTDEQADARKPERRRPPWRPEL